VPGYRLAVVARVGRGGGVGSGTFGGGRATAMCEPKMPKDGDSAILHCAVRYGGEVVRTDGAAVR
jgi:hypothetical protein